MIATSASDKPPKLGGKPPKLGGKPPKADDKSSNIFLCAHPAFNVL